MDSDSDETIIIESEDEPMEIEDNDEVESPEPSETNELVRDNNENNEVVIVQEQAVLQENLPLEIPPPSSRSNSPALLSGHTNDELPIKNEDTEENEGSPKKKRSYEACFEDDDDGKTCPICLDSWTNLGDHRICALKCGHLFGTSCIIQWFSTQKKKSCPTCKKKASRSEIRYIYAKKLVAMDVTELEEIKTQLDNVTQDKNRIQIELTKAICREHLIVQQMEDLKKRIETLDCIVKMQQSGRPVASSSRESSNSDKVTLFMDKSLEICKEGGCRVLDYCSNLNLLVASMQSPNNLFRGFGVRKIDVLTYRPTAFIPLHKMSIRDVCFHPTNPWLLSVSLDKTIKIVDAQMCTTVKEYNNGDVPLWSCCWDINNANMFYVGKQHGSIAKFDIRQMNEPVCQLEVPGDMSPVVSLAPIEISPGNAVPTGGVISCKLNSLWVFENSETTVNEYNRYPLSVEGPFLSMMFENRQLLVSTRSNARNPYSRHLLCNIENGTSNNLLCNTVHCFIGSSTQKLLSRSCMVSSRSNTYVAAHQEANRSILLWSTKTGQKSASIPARAPVLDLCGVNRSNGDALLASLTERKLEFFKFV